MVATASPGPAVVGSAPLAPLVSIVLPTYNGARYLAESIASCLGQTYSPLELVVVDDGSTGEIRSIVEAVADGRIRYLRHPENRGLPAALNTGCAASRGSFLTWTSDDNRYHPRAIARMVEHLQRHPDVGLVYAGCRLIDDQGRPGGSLPAAPPESIWVGNCVRACFLYRRLVFERVGFYDPDVPLVEDYDYWLRTARIFRLDRLDDTLYDLRVHPASLTRTLTLHRKRESHQKVLAKMRRSDVGPPLPAALLRRARAAMHAAYGRDSFFAGETRSARQDLLAALWYAPSNLFRWAILGPFLKSLAGDRLLRAVRAGGLRTARRPDPTGGLRILQCCGEYGAAGGGTERQARAVTSALAARGHSVCVVTRRSSPGSSAAPGVRVAAVIRAAEFGPLFGLTYLASATAALLRAAGEADVLHAHHLYLDAVAAVLAGRIRHRPVAAKMAGAGAGGDLDRLRRTRGGWFLLRVLRDLDAVIAPSSTCRGELLSVGFPAERIHVIPNGVDTSLFRPDPARQVATPTSIGRGPMVVYTGRLIEAKGLGELLEAWALVLRDVPEAQLVLVGAGPLEAELARRAALPPLAGRVQLAGEVPDVLPYLQAASAFVLPSWAEGLPNALLEAMATELPCVATDIGAIAEAATDGEHALLVPVQAPERLAAALAAILTQPALAARLGRAARQRVGAEFCLTRTVDGLEALYRDLCRSPRRGA